jgi:hypothetical protein
VQSFGSFITLHRSERTGPRHRFFISFLCKQLKVRKDTALPNRFAWIVVGGALLLAGCKGGTLGTKIEGTSGPGGGPTASATIDAAKLCDEYKAGESTADGHYKGKELHLKGSVRSVRDDKASGKKYLDVKGSESGSVRCDFAGDQDQLAKLRSGDEVKVTGTCKGKQGTGDHFTVHLDNCKLVK